MAESKALSYFYLKLSNGKEPQSLINHYNKDHEQFEAYIRQSLEEWGHVSLLEEQQMKCNSGSAGSSLNLIVSCTNLNAAMASILNGELKQILKPKLAQSGYSKDIRTVLINVPRDADSRKGIQVSSKTDTADVPVVKSPSASPVYDSPSQDDVTHQVSTSAQSSIDEDSYTVKSKALEDPTKDSGGRSFREEVIFGLDSDLQNWREETIMVPGTFNLKAHTKGNEAEHKLYELIERVGKHFEEPMFAFHSQLCTALMEPEQKNQNVEVDMLVVHKEFGLLFFESKSNSKSYESAKRDMKDRKKDVVARQLVKQYKNLNPQISITECQKVIRPLVYSYYPQCGFIFLPNDEVLQDDLCILKKDALCDSSFQKWWETNIRNVEHPPMTKELYEDLIVLLYGIRHVRPIDMEVENVHKSLTLYTNQQYELLKRAPRSQSIKMPPWDQIHGPLFITGPAGSGKTFCLIEKVIEVAKTYSSKHTPKPILVVCFNQPLMLDLSKQFKQHNVNKLVDVNTFDRLIASFLSKCITITDLSQQEKINLIDQVCQNLRLSPSKQQYDHIFVDEAQDLYGEWRRFLGFIQTSGSDHYWWVFYDNNQHVQGGTKSGISLLELNQSAYLLTKIVRNTENIYNLNKKYFTTKMTERAISLHHKTIGPSIEFIGIKPLENRETTIMNVVKAWKQKKIQCRDMCVLVNTNMDDAIQLRKDLIMLQDNSIPFTGCENRCSSSVTLDTIRRFKGLDSKVVILYDPPYHTGNQDVKELLYTATSRCCCLLIIITTSEGWDSLQSPSGVLD